LQKFATIAKTIFPNGLFYWRTPYTVFDCEVFVFTVVLYRNLCRPTCIQYGPESQSNVLLSCEALRPFIKSEQLKCTPCVRQLTGKRLQT